MRQRNVLLVDIPTYTVPISVPYRNVLERRLKAENVLREQKIGFPLRRPGLSYSRGLLLVAGYVERGGHIVKYLVYPDPNDASQFTGLCKFSDVVGITATTPVVQQAYKLFKEAKMLNPLIICVLGGPHANSRPYQCLEECAELDVVIAGEGEELFANLVDHLDAYQEEPGIISRQNGSKFINNPILASKRNPVSRNVPMPAYHLLSQPLSHYAHNIRTYNGCPYHCDFCIERFSWSGNRDRDNLDLIIDEIRLAAQGSQVKTLIHFSDSVFTLKKDRTIELCDRLAKEKLDVVFSCDTRVDHVDDEIIQALSKAGFVVVRLGVEILDDTVLRTVHKDILTEQSLEAINTIQRVNPKMVIHAYMLTGLPGTTLDTLYQSAKNIQDLVQLGKIDIIGNKILVPYPNTPYFSLPEKYHLEILHHNWSSFDRLSFPVYRLTNFSEYQIYFAFLYLESTLLYAYEARIVNREKIDAASNESLDYVYQSYVQHGRTDSI